MRSIKRGLKEKDDEWQEDHHGACQEEKEARWEKALMEIVEVRGQLTLEELGVSFEIDDVDDIIRLAGAKPRDDEKEHYAQLAAEFRLQVDDPGEEFQSRQLVVAKQPQHGTKLWCFTSIQLLRGREQDLLMVVMRSSSTLRLPSDLGFIMRLAMEYRAARVKVLIGSFHVELTDLDKLIVHLEMQR